MAASMRCRLPETETPAPTSAFASWVLDEMVERAADAVEMTVHDGLDRAMERFNAADPV